MTVLLDLLRVAVAVALILYIAGQCRKPSSFLGRRLARAMNLSHGTLTQWGLSHVDVGRAFTILDVGCGGGRTIETLAAAAPEGKVSGVDYSAASVDVARERNAASIESGRVDIRQASVSKLPFPSATFDLVTAVETHYYWPDLPRDLREIMRVLAPAGTVLIIAETYRGRTHDWLYLPVMRLLLRAHYLTVDGHRQLLADAGYGDVEVFTEPSHGWICVKGQKPRAAT
jgi:ubiquinone/menaquinone biosynthesis C-methylase UbiE